MSMPQGGGSSQPWETGPQPGAAGQQQPGAPGQGPGQEPGGQPSQGGYPGGSQGQQYGSQPPGGIPGQQYAGPMQGRPISPVNEIETRVTGRRIVQWIIDAIIFYAISSLLGWALDRGHGVTHALLYVVLVVLIIAWYVFYWGIRPYTRNGQTLGMQVLGIRVISRTGEPASLMQLIGRSILLVLFNWVSLIVGFITMMFSRYRQRVGDHLAGTMVVRASVEPIPAQREYAGAGQAGSR